MIKISISILIFAILPIYGQEDAITIHGRVIDQANSNKRIFAVRARLSFGDSLFIDTDIDSLGYYEFQTSRDFAKDRKITISTYQDLALLEKLFPRPLDCPLFFNAPDRYFKSSFIQLNVKSGASDYLANFELAKIIVCYRFPYLGFIKGSTKFLTFPADPSGDTVVYCIKNLLLDNPTVVIQIEAHSWKECHSEKLSLKRANFVKQKLVSLGIDSARIKSIGRGHTQPLMNSKAIRKANNRTEREALRAQNRRATIVILSWDYDPNLKKIVKPVAPRTTVDDDE